LNYHRVGVHPGRRVFDAATNCLKGTPRLYEDLHLGTDFYGEFDGGREKRVLVKIIGE
jgi:hypothetical protein